MTISFEGFSPKALTFLRQLKKNNSREWFTPRKDQFEELLRQPMLRLTGLVAERMRSFAVDYVRDPARAVHRIYRDVRFSKDKSPYKTNISAMFFRAGLAKNSSAGFYFSLTPDGFDIAGGMYMPGPAELLAIRKAIAADPAGFKKQIEPAGLVKLMGPCLGEQLTRPPKGFESPDELSLALLRRKQFYYYRTLEPAEATRPGLDQQIAKYIAAMVPAIESINQVLLNAAKGTEESPRRPRRPEPMF